MAITSTSEFEAVLSNVLMTVDRTLVERGEVAALKEARREFEIVLAASKDPAQLRALKARLDAAGDKIREQIPNDQPLAERLWDLVDFVEYRC